MDKLAMLSILFATVAVPVVFSRDPDPRRGIRKMAVILVLFIAAYVAYVALVHTTFFTPPPWRWG